MDNSSKYRKVISNLLLITAALAFIQVPLPAAISPNQQARDALVKGRSPLSEANSLVTAWYKKIGLSHVANLHEITPAGVWLKTHGQIYEDATDFGGDGFYIKDKLVYHISTGFGGFGINNIVVCDIDNDKHPEIVYTYSWGSGLHRAQIGVIDRCEQKPVVLTLQYVYCNYDLSLKNQSNRVFAYVMDRGNSHFNKYLLGELKLSQSKLTLNLSPKLTKEQLRLYSSIPIKL